MTVFLYFSLAGGVYKSDILMLKPLER